MTDDLRQRSPQEVFDDHLQLAAEHRFEEEEELPGAPYEYTTRLVAGRIAFLEWTAEAADTRVRDGADSFVIEDGWITAQTIHYTVEDKPSTSHH